jgi:DNA-binding NtrC family response regulator
VAKARDRILIAEDQEDLLQGLGRMIAMEMDCDIELAANGKQAVKVIKKKPVDLVLTDIRMPDMDGMELLARTRALDPYVTVVVMTAYGSIEKAVAAIKAGAYDFITKPFDEAQLLHVLGKGLERNRLIRENQRLQTCIPDGGPFQNMIGSGKKMKDIFETIQMLGRSDVTVMIRGESGTGKEMAARAVHAVGERRRYPMVTVNCPALPESILESELFGYKKGAFTNAASDRVGLFAEARQGTIFLDEVGDISLPLQAKLLRVIQEKEIKPLGSNRTRKIDVRIIVSTNQDLETKIREGSFREDLYYRFNVARLTMPPLRDRKEDIPLLVESFLKSTAAESHVEPKTVSSGTLNQLLAYDWPGNVRELENIIRGLTAVIPDPRIEKQHLPFLQQKASNELGSPDISRPYKELKEDLIGRFTVSYVHGLLRKTAGNVSEAAHLSRIKRQSLQKILRRYQIDPGEYRPKP